MKALWKCAFLCFIIVIILYPKNDCCGLYSVSNPCVYADLMESANKTSVIELSDELLKIWCTTKASYGRDCYSQIVLKIITENRLKDLIIIETDKAISDHLGYLPDHIPGTRIRWSCETVNDWSLPSWKQPLILTIIVDCPGMKVDITVKQVLHKLSRGRQGALTRPVLNWVILGGGIPEESASGLLDILTRADSLVYVNHVQPYTDSCQEEGYNFINASYGEVTISRVRKDDLSVPTITDLSISSRAMSTTSTSGLLSNTFSGFGGQTFVVASAPNYEPYNYVVKKTDGSKTFEGLAVDVIRILGHQFDFRCEFKPSVDSKYGAPVENGSWNGMVGMVIREEADIAAAALTVSAERKQVVDFTTAYYKKAAGLLVYINDNNNWLSFLQPLSYQVWLTYGACMVLCSGTITLILHVQRRAIRPSKCYSLQKIPPTMFSFGALIHQAVDLNADLWSVRVLVGAVWALALVMTSTYTGNLTASLSTQKTRLPFTSLSGLADQTHILPLINDGSSTLTLMKNSSSEIYSKIWEIIQKNPQTLYKTQTEADLKMDSGTFARVGDFTGLQVKAAVHKDCSLFVLPDRFFPSGYGIALPKGSPFTDIFSQKVRFLQEGGLDTHLFQNHQVEDRCSQKLKVKAKSRTLNLEKVVGLFVLLLCGIIIAFIVLGAEVLLYLRLSILRWFQQWIL